MKEVKNLEILKIYNNNVVSCLNKKGEEIILTGAGLGFKKKIGDSVEMNKVTQKFVLDDGKKKKMNQLVQRVPKEYFGLSEEILRQAETVLGKKMTLSTFMNFTDHIAGAIQRTKEGILLPNLVLMEVKTIWKEEFDLSLKMIDYIEEKTGVRLPVDEAGYMALYFTPEDQKERENRSLEMLQYVTDIVKIIEAVFEINIDRDSLTYMRLVTHLRFFIGRVMNKELRDETIVNENIYKLLVANDPRLLDCSRYIVAFVKKELESDVNRAEIVYLMIHITQILGN